ncbi:MAG TPA: glutamate--tRNA ligase family protein, partial [Gemmatimonas sp.]|nr:glutamate--tRNA ligase family protein [Gemmatimonas sp.]
RIEDHDRTRCRPEYERALLEDLEWLGLHPDEGSLASYAARHAGDTHPHPLRQSDNDDRYATALGALDERGLVYPCICTRRDIAAGEPRTPGEELRYPGTCRPRVFANAHTNAHYGTLARRVKLSDENETFDDLRRGVQLQQPSQQCGDVLARDRHGGWTYQFAVSVDDMQQGIDVVIRGEDLLASTGRQLQLSRLLGRASPPSYLHHPLLMRDDGIKLSKANHDTSLRLRRAGGASAAELLGEAAYRAALIPRTRALHVTELAGLFSPLA